MKSLTGNGECLNLKVSVRSPSVATIEPSRLGEISVNKLDSSVTVYRSYWGSEMKYPFDISNSMGTNCVSTILIVAVEVLAMVDPVSVSLISISNSSPAVKEIELTVSSSLPLNANRAWSGPPIIV